MRLPEGSPNAPPSTPVFVEKRTPTELNFHERLVSLRKDCGLTQPALAESVGMHISQIRRYGSRQSQPMLDAFEKDERGPDDELKLHFKAASRLDPEEKKVILSAIESIILRNTMKESAVRFSTTDSGGSR